MDEADARVEEVEILVVREGHDGQRLRRVGVAVERGEQSHERHRRVLARVERHLRHELRRQARGRARVDERDVERPRGVELHVARDLAEAQPRRARRCGVVCLFRVRGGVDELGSGVHRRRSLCGVFAPAGVFARVGARIGEDVASPASDADGPSERPPASTGAVAIPRESTGPE